MVELKAREVAGGFSVWHCPFYTKLRASLIHQGISSPPYFGGGGTMTLDVCWHMAIELVIDCKVSSW